MHVYAFYSSVFLFSLYSFVLFIISSMLLLSVCLSFELLMWIRCISNDLWHMFYFKKIFLDLINRKKRREMILFVIWWFDETFSYFQLCVSRQAIMIHRISMENLRMNLFNWQCAINNFWWILIRMNLNHFHISIRHSLQHHHLWQQPSKKKFSSLFSIERDMYSKILFVYCTFCCLSGFCHCVWFYYSVSLLFFLRHQSSSSSFVSITKLFMSKKKPTQNKIYWCTCTSLKFACLFFVLFYQMYDWGIKGTTAWTNDDAGT